LPTDDRERLPALGGTLTDCCRRRARIAGVIGIACEQRRRIFMKSILVGSSALGVALAAAISLPAMAQAVPISQEACEALMGLELPVDGIELETTGGTVDATEWVQSDSNGTYCKVLGSIDPVDPEAWPILWQANLPSSWNGKAIQYGGGGYNGTIPNALRPVQLGLSTTATPLALNHIGEHSIDLDQ